VHSGYKKAVLWMFDLKSTKYEINRSNLFDASMAPVSNISNGSFSVLINPFGEAYPELGNGEGVTIFCVKDSHLCKIAADNNIYNDFKLVNL
jgi:hypothetical protein